MYELTKVYLIVNCIVYILSGHQCVAAIDLQGLDDAVLFKMNWPGDEALIFSDEEPLVVKTANDEKYKCLLPSIEKKQANSAAVYDGPTPIELLKPLFQESLCSYRLESYWTYEVCHGRYIRQYHEDREGKKVKIHEYYLGQWDKNEQLKVIEELKIAELSPNDKNKNVPVKKIDGVQLPYFEVTMSDGTMCDLSGKPRSTKVLYVCYPHDKLELYSLKETSTCEYEVIVLTTLLCPHPRYKPQESEENVINCIPLEGGPKKPRSMIAMDSESLRLRHQSKTVDDKPKKVYAVFKVDKDGQNGEARVRVEIRPIDVLAENELEKLKQVPRLDGIKDTSPVENFLLGKHCLNGGTGWWKYDFCYGRYVEQYHIEKDGSRTAVNLGRFDKNTHLQWLERNQHKRPKPLAQRKQLSHFYSDGTVCDKTGKHRQTEVKLKCLENSSSPAAVQLYLLEPKYCEYILGVESPLICDILSKADENGLVDIPDRFSRYSENAAEDDDVTPAAKVVDQPLNNAL